MAADWAELPPELLRTIAEILTTEAADYIRFRAVCTTWRSSSLQTPPNLPTQLPWLLLPPPPPSPTHSNRHRFFSLSANKVLSYEFPISPSLRLIGSSHGWLAYVDATSDSLSLFNPLTRSRLTLPPLSSFPDVISFDPYSIGCEYTLENRQASLELMCHCFIKKIVLSSSPSVDQNYIVLCMIGLTGKTAFCKNGDQSWTYIEDARLDCEDVIFHKNSFYAVTRFGNIVAYDVHEPLPRVSVIKIESHGIGDLQYLASSSDGNLLMIGRYMEFDYFDNGYKTTRFNVFRLDLSEEKWDSVTDLRGDMLFLGGNSTLALSSRDFRGCSGDCIYYTDDFSECENDYVYLYGDPDAGIYDLSNERIEPFPYCWHSLHSPRLWPPPVWVTPSPFG